MRIYLWGAISNEVLGVSGYLVADKLNFGPRGRGDVKSEAVSRIAYLGGGAGHEDTKNHRFPRLTRIRKATKTQRHKEIRHGLTLIDTVCDLTQRESRITQIFNGN